MEAEIAAPSETSSLWGQVVRWIIGLGVAGLACWLLARDLDWQELLAQLREADYAWVILGILAIIGTFFIRARRWQTLLFHSRVSLRSALTALLVGQVVNMALPMRGGDVARAAWLGPERETGTVEALGSIAIEKVWDLLALLTCGVVLLIWMPLPPWFARSTWGTALVLGVGVGLLWTGLHWQQTLFDWAGRLLAYLPAGWDDALLPRLRRLASGLEAIRRTDTFVRVSVWTALNWGLGALANWAALAAFGIPSGRAALLLLTGLMASGMVPTPAKLGIFEGVSVVCLALFGVPTDQAVAIGVVLHLVVMVPPVVAAALLVLWSRLFDSERAR